LAIGSYAAGAIAVGVGAYLFVSRPARRGGPTVSAAPAPGGGFVWAEWEL
jgi:hypothetical protein